MIGQKGVPATHGGVERHVEELGARLVELGHEVTVYTRPHYTDPALHEYRGMRLVSLPTVGTKHLDAIVHSTLASFAACGGGYDVVHYHAIGPSLASPIARIRGRTVVATIHGQDWRRAKWGRAASATLRLSEWTALHVPAATIVVSRALAGAYRDAGAERVVYLPNGVTVDSGDEESVLGELGVEPGRYVLFAGRVVPEKGLHYLLEAYAADSPDVPLVVAGDSSHSARYADGLRDSAGPGVLFAGYRYGAQLAALFRHCALFVLPSDLEGLPIVLLEALAYGCPVLASDIAPNREVLGAHGMYFEAGSVDSLREGLAIALADRGRLKSEAESGRDSILAEYDWERVARETVKVYRFASGLRDPGHD